MRGQFDGDRRKRVPADGAIERRDVLLLVPRVSLLSEFFIKQRLDPLPFGHGFASRSRSRSAEPATQ